MYIHTLTKAWRFQICIIGKDEDKDMGQTQPFITSNSWKNQTLLLTRSGHEPHLGLVVTKNELGDSEKKWLDTPTKSISHVLGIFIAKKCHPTLDFNYLLHTQLSSLAVPVNSTHRSYFLNPSKPSQFQVSRLGHFPDLH